MYCKYLDHHYGFPHYAVNPDSESAALSDTPVLYIRTVNTELSYFVVKSVSRWLSCVLRRG